METNENESQRDGELPWEPPEERASHDNPQILANDHADHPHGPRKPTVVGDAVEIGDHSCTVSLIEGDAVVLTRDDDGREFVVPVELVPSVCVRNVESTK